MSYADRLAELAENDARILEDKDAQYGGSWLKRGGVGAFMMAARKWDRLETAMTADLRAFGLKDKRSKLSEWDIIGRAVLDPREEGLLDDIGDLRRYLLLIEAEIREQAGHPRIHIEFPQPDRLDVFSPTSPSGTPDA